MPNTDQIKDEAEISQLIDGMSDAWRRGDAKAFGTRYRSDGTFTNVFGDFYVGRDAFDRRHDDVFRGIFRSSTLTMDIRKLRFLRPDVATVDIATTVAGVSARLPGVEPGPDGALHSALLMVLVKEHGRWGIAAYHNVWQSPR